MWGNCKLGISKLILNYIRANIAYQIATHAKIVEYKPTIVPKDVDQTSYDAEVYKDLGYLYNRLNVNESKCCCENEQL